MSNTLINGFFFSLGMVWIIVGALAVMLCTDRWSWLDNAMSKSVVLTLVLLLLWPAVLLACAVRWFINSRSAQGGWL